MERSKLRPESSYWQEIFDRADEGSIREKLGAKVEQQKRAVVLASRILSMENQPGYTEFRKALLDIREHALGQLVRNTATNEWMRVLQGQCQAYDSILQVMERGQDRVQALELALKDLQDQMTLLERPKTQEAKP